MSGSPLKLDARRSRILGKLKREGTVSVSQLAQELGATTVTIRGDLDALEAEGHLIRVQGGAVPNQRGQNLFSGSGRENMNPGEKLSIARAVAAMIHDGDTLLINSGTTMQMIAAALRVRKHLNIVTNSLSVATELGSVPGFRVILLGGEMNGRFGFTYGSDAQEQLSCYQADWAIMSLDGICPESGLTTYHAEEANINRMMIQRSKQLLVAADHTKVGRKGFFRFWGIEDGIRLVTDDKVSAPVLSALEKQGVSITVVR